MPLDVPNLDDRRWADLVEEGRALIPRVAPRWTDHNVHDPGITFIELFAWLAEMQMYQLNRVGGRHREVFARLAGIERRGPTPARADVMLLDVPANSTILPAGTQLAPAQGDEIVFETTTELRLTRSRLVRIIVSGESGGTDQTEANGKSGVAFLAFGEQAEEGAELRLAFDRLYEGERNLRLNVSVFTDDLAGSCVPELSIAIAEGGQGDEPPPVDLAWEYLAAGGTWRPLEDVTDETRAFSRSGAVLVALPPRGSAVDGAFWIRARIHRGTYDIEPRLRHVQLNLIPCVQTQTIRDELLGRGDGRPDQSFTLSGGPLLLVSPEPRIVTGPTHGIPHPRAGDRGARIVIEVADEPWVEVASLEDSGPDSAHYVFSRETGEITFGNGVNGQVPTAGQDIRVRSYRTTSGRAGNVAKGLFWRLRTAEVPGVRLTNHEPAAGGEDVETLDEMELRAQAFLSRPDRAVTVEDIERLALSTPAAFVARAHVIPNCPRAETITVVVVPKVRPGRPGPPRKTSAPLIEAVRRHLESRRLLCDQVHVVGPKYVEVRVTARLRLTKGAGAALVVERAREALGRFLGGDTRVLTTGDASRGASPPSPCPTAWPFGRRIFPSEVYAVLDGVAGVDSVSGLVLRGSIDGRAMPPDASGAIPVPRTGLVYPGEHDLTADAGGRAPA